MKPKLFLSGIMFLCFFNACIAVKIDRSADAFGVYPGDSLRKKAMLNFVCQNWTEKAKAQGKNVLHYTIDLLKDKKITNKEAFFMLDILKCILKKNNNFVSTFICGKFPVIYVVEKFQLSPFLIDIVKALLKYGGNPNSCDASGWSLLHYAVLYEDFKLTDLLVKRFKADVNVVLDDQGTSPLHIACAHGDVKNFDLLMDNGANKNVCDWCKCLPLHYATGKGMILCNSCASFKIAPFDESKKLNSSLYEKQISYRNHIIERLMIEGKLDCLQKDKNNSSAYDYAESYLHVDLCATMCRLDKELYNKRDLSILNKDQNEKKSKKEKTEEYKNGAFGIVNHWIANAQFNNKPLLQYMFELTNNVSSLSDFDLIYDGLDYILGAYPDLIKQKIGDKDPIFYAVENLIETPWVRSIVEILLNHGANADSCDENGLSILHLAIKGDNWELFKTIADQHADLMVHTNKEKTSLLHWACFYGNKKIFDYLLDHSVDVKFADVNDDTALHFAAGCGYVFQKGIYKLIYVTSMDISKDNKSFYEEQTAIRKYMIKRLVYDFNASLVAEDNGCLTAQDFAELFGHKELLALLVELKRNRI
jgi:ankyrin repeat protein